jgi:hypothetical protein
MVFGRDPRLINLFVETHMQNEDRRKWVQQLVYSQAKKFMVIQISIIFFLSYYYFFKIC